MVTFAADNIYNRTRSRLRYLAAVEITTITGLRVRGNIRDIGIEGVFVKADKKNLRLLFCEIVDVAMTVTQGESRLTICTPGKIIREESDGYAIKFTEPLKWWPIFSLFPINESFMYDIVSKA